MVVTLSHTGYIKSQPLAEYRAQKRGGRGKQATATKEDDWIDQLFIANTHDWILCFSDRGRVYWLKVWEVPQGGRASRGKPIVNMFPLQPGEKITVVLSTSNATKGAVIFGTSSEYDHANERLGVGTLTPGAKLHALATTEQLRLGYDASNYASTTVSAAGVVANTATGGQWTYRATSSSATKAAPTKRASSNSPTACRATTTKKWTSSASSSPR
jgi:DNA gyrase/topoisomerase IV subunit A